MYNPQIWNQVSFYQSLPRLRRDIDALMGQMNSLRPNVGSFNTGGRQVTLFFLHGTVPIVYNGVTYNIPVTIYFDPPYPAQGPRCFVSPTPTMRIKNRHKHVDQRGMIYLPYLSSWNPNTSSLTELVTIIASTFSTDPPVYSVPQAQAHTAQQTQTLTNEQAASNYAGPAQPVQQQQQQYTPPYVAQPQQQQPTMPAYGQQPVQQQQTQQQQGGGGLFSSVSNLISRVTGVGPQPPGGAGGLTNYAGSPMNVAGGAHTPVTPQHTQPPARPREDVLREETTGNLKARWTTVVSPIAARMDDLLEMQETLEASKVRTEQQLTGLKAEGAQLDADIAAVEGAIGDAKKYIEAEKARPFVASQIVQAADPLSAQLLDVSAEDAATDDLIDGMDQLLAEKKCGLNEFLQGVREVSREQFFRLQLKKKIIRAQRQKAAATAQQRPVQASYLRNY